jgi:DNA ligase-1
LSFDSIQKSTRHKSGFALRFPRIVRLLPDKRPEEVDTLQTGAQIYEKITCARRESRSNPSGESQP